MTTIPKVVLPPLLHRHIGKGVEGMHPKPKKEFKFGNSTVIIHSKLVLMDHSEQQEYFKTELEKRSPVLMNIAKQIVNCQSS